MIKVETNSANQKDISKHVMRLGYSKQIADQYAKSLIAYFTKIQSSPFLIESENKQNSLCFIGVNADDLNQYTQFARSILPSLTSSDIRQLILGHEESHCAYLKNAAHLLFFTNNSSSFVIEEARAEADSYLRLKKPKNADPDKLLHAILTKRFFDGLKMDVNHAATFLMLDLIKDRDASISHAVQSFLKISKFDYLEYETFYSMLSLALRVGRDGSSEQKCAWEEVVSKTPDYFKSTIPSLSEVRAAGIAAWPDSSDWRKDALLLQFGLAPANAGFHNCAKSAP